MDCLPGESPRPTRYTITVLNSCSSELHSAAGTTAQALSCLMVFSIPSRIATGFVANLELNEQPPSRSAFRLPFLRKPLPTSEQVGFVSGRHHGQWFILRKS
jgi:hypothetical protein